MPVSTPISDPPMNTGYISHTYPPLGCGSTVLNYSTHPFVTVSAVETKAGWIGQVRVDGTIAWESSPQPSEVGAREAAKAHIVKRLS